MCSSVIRITRVGVVILALALTSVLLAIFASGALQAVGFTVAVLIGLLIAGEGMSGRGGPQAARRKAEVARERAMPRPDRGPVAPEEPVDDLWARERARRRGA